MNSPESTHINSSSSQPESSQQPSALDNSKLTAWSLSMITFCTVILPSLALGIALLMNTGGIGISFALPSWYHVAALILLIISGTIFLYETQKTDQQYSAYAAAGVGFSFLVSLYYTILFLPVLPMGIMAIVAFGLGLLILSPVFSLFYQIKMWKRIGNRKPIWIGIMFAFFLLAWADCKGLYTQYVMHRYALADQAKQEQWVDHARKWANEDTLLKACYNSNSTTWNHGLGQQLFKKLNPKKLSTNESQILYYRITGKAFNNIDVSHSRSNIAFDEDHGDDNVGGKIKDLDLVHSRLDVNIDQSSQIGYAEWVIQFRNHSKRNREARMKFVLPDNGFISRVTLWVEGEEREAAYNTVSKVKSAYKQIAVNEMRDPVLVNMCAPNTFRLQCFPVLTGGKPMKMKVGYNFTVGDKLRAPFIMERNFGISSSFKHSLYAQGATQFATDSGRIEHRDSGDVLFASYDYKGFKQQNIGFTVTESPGNIWSRDSVSNRYVVKSTASNLTNNNKVTVVVDGSVALRPYTEELNSIAKLPMVKEVILASKGFQVKKVLRKEDFLGGQDNVKALMEAMRGENDVIWIHAGQPVDFGWNEELIQELERGQSKSRIMSFCIADGGNKLIEDMWKQQRITSHHYIIDSTDLLEKVQEGFNQETHQFHWQDTPPNKGIEVSDHLVHQAIFSKVYHDWLNKSDTEKTAALASRHQLVTPISGAVVLENEEQYKRTGLKPVSGEESPTIPNSVPEPSTWILFILSSLGIWKRNRKRA